MRNIFLALIALVAPNLAFAGVEHSTVGVQGYDLVSYHNSSKPIQGNGNNVATHKGVTYLFATKENKETFAKNPGKYVPAYGGYCAYGVSVGKKFVGDANVWEIVDGKLYLNLDKKVQNIWSQDIPGNIKSANVEWKKIRDKSPAEL